MPLEALISADSHVMEPADLWEGKLGSQFGEKIPRRIKNHKGLTGEFLVFQTNHGEVPIYTTKQFVEAAGGSPEMSLAGHDPAQRIKCQEKDRLIAEVLYPTYGLFVLNLKDSKAMMACCEVYNDWIANYCSYNPERLIGIAMTPPMVDVDWAVNELQRVAKMGIRGTTINSVPLPGYPPYRDRRYDRFWKTAEELSIPITLHALTGGLPDPLTFVFRTNEEKEHGLGAWVRLYEDITVMLSNDFIGGRIFDRYPRLKVVTGEYEVSWVPYFMFRLDQAWQLVGNFYGLEPLKKGRVSDYIKENMYHGFVDDPHAASAAQALGSDIIMWGSDFPHPRNPYPNSLEVVKNVLKALPDEDQEKLAWKNAAKLYNISLAR